MTRIDKRDAKGRIYSTHRVPATHLVVESLMECGAWSPSILFDGDCQYIGVGGSIEISAEGE